jgi:hypothetical protein
MEKTNEINTTTRRRRKGCTRANCWRAESIRRLRELDLKIHLAAGFVDARHPYWADGEPRSLKFRMKSTGAVLESGFEQARRAILSGAAELAEAC